MDPRHKKRIKIVQELYSEEFLPQSSLLPKTRKIKEKEDKFIEIVKKFAVKLPVEKIPKIDMAILKLALYELLVEKKEPIKVIIDEAVELAKELGGEKSYAFVNAILGKVIKEIKSL